MTVKGYSSLVFPVTSKGRCKRKIGKIAVGFCDCDLVIYVTSATYDYKADEWTLMP